MAMIYIAIASALDLVSCITLILYRKRYPILERSPTLTISASNFLLLSTLPFPLWIILKYYEVVEESQLELKNIIIMIALTSYVMFFTMTAAKVSRILYVVYSKNPRRGYRILGNEMIMLLILSGIMIPISFVGFYLYFVQGDIQIDHTLNQFINI